MPKHGSSRGSDDCAATKCAAVFCILVLAVIGGWAAAGAAQCEYVVTITNDSVGANRASVSATIDSPAEGTIISFSNGMDNGLRFIGGSQLLRMDSGEWAAPAGQVKLEYSVRTDVPAPMTPGSYLAYLEGDCGILDMSSILLVPEGMNGNATVRFVLPDGWAAFPDGSWSDKENGSAYEVPLGDLSSLVSVGKQRIFNGTLDSGKDIEVAVCGKQKKEAEEYSRNIKLQVDYLERNLLALPLPYFRAVVTDLPLPRDYMSSPPRLAVSARPGDWGMFEGMLWHYWCPQGLAYKDQNETDRSWWVFEGLSPFFLYPVYWKIRDSGTARAISEGWGSNISEFSWRMWYDAYRKRKGTKYDAALVDYPRLNRETGDIGYYVPTPYVKSFLVLHLLDESLRQVSDAAIQEVARELFRKAASEKQGMTTERLLEIASNISGNDFSAFFSAYVYGNEPLPISGAGIDWAALSDKIYASEPNSAGLLPLSATESPARAEKAEPPELEKESAHFTVFFDPPDSAMAANLLVDCEKAYRQEAWFFGREAATKIRNFVTYNGTEYAILGGNPSRAPEYEKPDVSAGGLWSDKGDEILWLRPIMRPENAPQMSTCLHELGHAMLRQTYPGTYKNYEQWFSESGYLGKKIWLWGNYSAEEFAPPFGRDAQYYAKVRDALVSSNGSPEMTFAALAKLDWGNASEDERAFHSVVGDLFGVYLDARYEDGYRRFLAEYDKGVPLRTAVESAFGVSFGDFEADFWRVARRAAEDSDRFEGAVAGLGKAGVATNLTEKLGEQVPFYGLFLGYASAGNAGVPLDSIQIVEAAATSAATTTAGREIGTRPPANRNGASNFPWLLVPVALAILALGLWLAFRLLRLIVKF